MSKHILVHVIGQSISPQIAVIGSAECSAGKVNAREFLASTGPPPADISFDEVRSFIQFVARFARSSTLYTATLKDNCLQKLLLLTHGHTNKRVLPTQTHIDTGIPRESRLSFLTLASFNPPPALRNSSSNQRPLSVDSRERNVEGRNRWYLPIVRSYLVSLNRASRAQCLKSSPRKKLSGDPR